MSPPDYCLFWISHGLCMPRSDWASWVQAVGSIAGIFTAVGLVWWQQREMHRQHIAAAHVVGSTVLFMVSQVVGCLESVRISLLETKDCQTPLLKLKGASMLLEMLELPNEDELVRLSFGDPHAAVCLARGRAAALQLRGAIDLLVRLGEQPAASVHERALPLAGLATTAISMFQTAEGRLNNFCR